MRTFKVTTITLAFVGAFAVAGIPADAADHQSNAQTERLEAARDTLAWQAQTLKGTPSHELRFEQQRVEDLIDRLQRGERVDPAEIDRAERRAR